MTERTPGWKEIKTAPKDGQIVVGYYHKGKWVKRLARLDRETCVHRWLTVPGDIHIDPTYWYKFHGPPPRSAALGEKDQAR